MRRIVNYGLAAAILTAGSLATCGLYSQAWGQGGKPVSNEPGLDDTQLCESELSLMKGRDIQAFRDGNTLVCLKKNNVIDDNGETGSDRLLKVVLQRNAQGFWERIGKGIKDDRLFTASVGGVDKVGMLKGDRKWEESISYPPSALYSSHTETRNFAAYSDVDGPYLEIRDDDEVVDVITLGTFKSRSLIEKQEQRRHRLSRTPKIAHSGTQVDLSYTTFGSPVPVDKQAEVPFQLYAEVKSFELIIKSKVDAKTWTDNYYIHCDRAAPTGQFSCEQSSRFSPKGTGVKCAIATRSLSKLEPPSSPGTVRKCGQNDGWDKVSKELRDRFDESAGSRIDFGQQGSLLQSDAFKSNLPVSFPRPGRYLVTSRGIAAELVQKIMFALSYSIAVFPTHTIDTVYKEGLAK